MSFPISLQLCAAVRAAESEAAAEQLVQVLYDQLEKSKEVESAPQTETLVLDVPESPLPEPEPSVDLHVPAAAQATKGKGGSKLSSNVRRLSSKPAPTVKFADEADGRPSTRGDKAATAGTQPADVVDPAPPLPEPATSTPAAASKGGASAGPAAPGTTKERPDWRETGAKKRILGTPAGKGGPALAKIGSKGLSNNGSSPMEEAQPAGSRQLSGISATSSAAQLAPAEAAATGAEAAAASEDTEPAQQEEASTAPKPARRRKPAALPVERPPWQAYERRQPAKDKPGRPADEASDAQAQQAQMQDVLSLVGAPAQAAALQLESAAHEGGALAFCSCSSAFACGLRLRPSTELMRRTRLLLCKVHGSHWLMRTGTAWSQAAVHRYLFRPRHMQVPSQAQLPPSLRLATQPSQEWWLVQKRRHQPPHKMMAARLVQPQPPHLCCSSSNRAHAFLPHRMPCLRQHSLQP